MPSPCLGLARCAQTTSSSGRLPYHYVLLTPVRVWLIILGSVTVTCTNLRQDYRDEMHNNACLVLLFSCCAGAFPVSVALGRSLVHLSTTLFSSFLSFPALVLHPFSPVTCCFRLCIKSVDFATLLHPYRQDDLHSLSSRHSNFLCLSFILVHILKLAIVSSATYSLCISRYLLWLQLATYHILLPPDTRP